MNNRFNDPFYAESSWLRSEEESGNYNQPAGPEQNSTNTFPSGQGMLLNTGNTGSTGNNGGTGGKINWNAILQNAPQIIGAVGGIVGTVKASGGGGSDSVKAVCGRRPLFNIGGKKDRYRECAERVLNPPQAQQFTPPPPGMSTTTKILIGVGIFIFLGVMVFVVVKVSRNKSN
jgi:hypothetical protein